MQTTGEILDEIRRLKGLDSDAALGAVFGVKQSTVASWRARNSLPYEEVITFCDKEGVSTDDLFLKRSFNRDGRRSPREIPSIQDRQGVYDRERYSEVGVYALAGAGPARDLVDHDPIEMIMIPKSFWKPSISAIKVRGRSMEPLILDGAYLGIDREDKWIISGEIYAVWIPYEGAVIKRLYIDPEKITLKSDNLSFPEFSILVKEASPEMILGRVKWVLQQF